MLRRVTRKGRVMGRPGIRVSVYVQRGADKRVFGGTFLFDDESKSAKDLWGLIRVFLLAREGVSGKDGGVK